MSDFSRPTLDVLVVRDPRESTKKCSLSPLRGMPGVRFATYAHDRRIAAGRRLLLHTEGELLSPSDAHLPILLVDCCWRRVPTLLRTIDGEFVRRRLPPLATAYPRTSELTPDPEQGLASVEALYAALALLGNVRPELLLHYRWREEFLARNAVVLGSGSAAAAQSE